MVETAQALEPKRRVAVVASLARSLWNFRLELLSRLVANGHEVIAMAPDEDAKARQMLADRGVAFETFPLSRTGLNPVADMGAINALTKRFREMRPDVVLPYTIKPILYANIAAQRARVPHRFALFTGMGYAFQEERPRGKLALVRGTAIALHRVALRGLTHAFAYNEKEIEDIRRFRLTPPSTPVTLVPGSGVDTALFADTPPPTEPPRFLMIARLLKTKGVHVYRDAARKLKETHPGAVVRLLGPLDSNPDGITREELDAWRADGLVEYLGETDDVRPYLADASVFVLPTMYREGVPRTILEAMATGRAVITTDAPGCGETVIDGQTGFVAPQGDADALAAAMAKFAQNPALITQMGAAGRARACAVYDVHSVNRLLLTTMGLEGETAPQGVPQPAAPMGAATA